jgi:hypothetical protein
MVARRHNRRLCRRVVERSGVVDVDEGNGQAPRIKASGASSAIDHPCG